MAYKLNFKPYGEHAILIEWPASINENILSNVLSFKQKILNLNIKQLVEVRNAYNSLLVVYAFDIDNVYDEIQRLKSLYESGFVALKMKSTLWKVPVCYDARFGVDLNHISEVNNLKVSDIIRHHSEAIYTVFFIGFLPGFLYLGGLDKRLHIPRKSTPRLQIEKGAVAIGGNQTGIYPNASPGGWNIIGNSPINFFNVKNSKPCFAQAGDRIRFFPITLKEYENIKLSVNEHVYQLESEVIDG